jgi:CRISPR-associated protein Csm1
LKNKVEKAIIGALLHDIGKVIYRGSGIDGRAHSVSGTDFIKKYIDDKEILDCIRYHHKDDLKNVSLEKDSPAYLVYIADNISSGIDRRHMEGVGGGFDKNRLLESIYNLLNNRNGNDTYTPTEIKKIVKYPDSKPSQDLSHAYNKLFDHISQGLKGIFLNGEYINSLLELTEANLSYVPSSTHKGQVSDISLYDHLKITAAFTACIALYLQSNQKTNYRSELFENEKEFLAEEAFAMLSIDISGIQQFIYSISSKGALKALRSRSFYLEILLENTMDEIMYACGLTRANILYTGGGHAYALLPNTESCRRNIENIITNINKRLIDAFQSNLFIAYGFVPCSANELMSQTQDPESYSNIFRNLSMQISSMKLRRYSPDDIRKLNSTSSDGEGQECSVCGISEKLLDNKDIGIICQSCASFIDISNELIRPSNVLVVSKQPMQGDHLVLFSGSGSNLYLHSMTEKIARQALKEEPGKIVRIYSKNAFRTGLSLSSKLWMGDFYAKDHNGNLQTFEELAKQSSGIDRVGVLRADVDDLGSTIVKGFIRERDDTDKYRYVTISRTATLSRSLSIFFKYYINDILSNPSFSLTGKNGPRNVVIVYSGGDDMFIVGAWDEVLAAAVDIRRAFSRYTSGALTLSAGYAFYDYKYPISLMAEETAQLEKRAKMHEYKGGTKNSISLFGLEYEEGRLVDRHTYDWEAFEEKVLGEKYKIIQELYNECHDYGNSFLYSIIGLLRQADKDRINIARLAYLLARREPARSAPLSAKEAYKNFTRNIYKWALDDEDRRQLITAIIILVYTIRNDKGE